MQHLCSLHAFSLPKQSPSAAAHAANDLVMSDVILQWAVHRADCATGNVAFTEQARGSACRALHACMQRSNSESVSVLFRLCMSARSAGIVKSLPALPQVGGEKDHGFDRARYERLLREHSRYQRYLRVPAVEAQ